ncbi:RNA polymerase sigma factor [Tenacibaculum xiamenense]|uniref:RNA polymerase sigma factor n=1 Tax=Tenacibaculum xiamenense TaxID=1261553 RepID=UPI0038966A98
MKLEELIRLCAKKDFKAQGILYKKYKDILFGISLKYCTNKEEAKDNLQESFIAIFDAIQKYKYQGSFEGWMKRITINKAIDRYKKNIYTEPWVEDRELYTTVETETMENIPLSIILGFIQNLPDKYRICFNLYELDNHTHKEIGDLLSISEGTSKSNVSRAKKILKERVEKYKQTKYSYER